MLLYPYGFPAPLAGHTEHLRLSNDLDTVLLQRRFERQSDIFIHLRQDRTIPLDYRDFRAESGKELSQLERHWPRPQYQQGSRLHTQVYDRVAREETCVR